MKNIEQLLTREHWVQYLESAINNDLTDLAIADGIVEHIGEALQDFTDDDILDEIDADMNYLCVPQGEIESMRQDWRNRFLILRRKRQQMTEIKRTMIASLLIERATEMKGKRPSELGFEDLVDVVQAVVKNHCIIDVKLPLPFPDKNSMRQIAQHTRNSEESRDPLIYEQGILRGMEIMKNIVSGY